MSLDSLIEQHTKAMRALQTPVNQVSDDKPYREPTIRDYLHRRLDDARRQAAMCEAMLNELPESFLNAPHSITHQIF